MIILSGLLGTTIGYALGIHNSANKVPFNFGKWNIDMSRGILYPGKYYILAKTEKNSIIAVFDENGDAGLSVEPITKDE